MYRLRFVSGFARLQCVRWVQQHQSGRRFKIEKAADDIYWKFFSRNHNVKMDLQLDNTKYFTFDRHMTLFNHSKGYQFVKNFGVKDKNSRQIKEFANMVDMTQTESDLKPEIIMSIGGQLSEMSLNELSETISLTCEIPWHKFQNSPEVLLEFRSKLDTECNDRLKTLKENSKLSDSKVKQTLMRMGNSFVNLDLCSKNQGSRVWRSKYLQSLVQSYLSETNIELLELDELTYLFFIVGRIRSLPTERFRLNQVDDGSSGLPIYLANHLEKCASKLSLNEIGIISEALHMTHTRLNTETSGLNNSLLQFLIDHKGNMTIENDIAINSLCKLLKSRGTTNHDLIQKVIKHYSKLVSKLKPVTQVRLSQLVLTGSQKNYEGFLHSFAQSIKLHFKHLRLKDVEQVCFALYYCNYDQDPSVYKEIINVLEDFKFYDPRMGRSLIYIMNFLSKKKFFMPQKLDFLYTKVNDRADDFLKAQSDQQKLTELGIDFTFQLTDASISSFRNHKDYESRKSWRLYINALNHLAEMDVNIEIDFPDYQGQRLNPDLRKLFLDLAVSEPENSKSSKLRKQVLQDLEIIFKHVYFMKVLPHSRSQDILIRIGKPLPGAKLISKPVSQDNLENVSNLQQPIITQQSNNDLYLVVMVPKWDNFDGNGNLMGPTTHRVRQFEKLGFIPIVVPFYAYIANHKEYKSRNFLINLIKSHVPRV